MKFEDLEFKDVGCCEIHRQASVTYDDVEFHVTESDNFYNLIILNKYGLLFRKNNLTVSELVSEMNLHLVH